VVALKPAAVQVVAVVQDLVLLLEDQAVVQAPTVVVGKVQVKILKRVVVEEDGELLEEQDPDLAAKAVAKQLI
jgi:hypothetical protein